MTAWFATPATLPAAVTRGCLRTSTGDRSSTHSRAPWEPIGLVETSTAITRAEDALERNVSPKVIAGWLAINVH